MDKPHPSAAATSPQGTSWTLLRELYRGIEPPAGLEARILARVACLQKPAPQPASPSRTPNWVQYLGPWLGMRPLATLGLGLSIMALVGLSGFWLGEYAGRRDMHASPHQSVAIAPTAMNLDTPYILIQAPAHGRLEPAQVIRIDLPRETMREFGWPLPAAQLTGKVRTELLLGASGELLAIRFLGSADRPEGASNQPGVVVAGLSF